MQKAKDELEQSSQEQVNELVKKIAEQLEQQIQIQLIRVSLAAGDSVFDGHAKQLERFC